jgi:2-polyprenyl-6-methoxyphenol hydroxylase-like FAD-dependent oxidoreductase
VDDVKLLTVAVDRLLDWSKPGLLCIGDAAHAMSPVGGVGINLAIQDAVAAANLLAAKLRAGGRSRRTTSTRCGAAASGRPRRRRRCRSRSRTTSWCG